MRALDCRDCRAAWLKIRTTDLVRNKPPAARKALLDMYLGEYHRQGHDLDRTTAAFAAQEAAAR